MNSPTNRKPAIVAVYDYHDETGTLLFQAVRYEPGFDGERKTFRQRRPDGNGGWIGNLQGVRLVPYRLPELVEASRERPVFVVEGEKDADSLHALGMVATTNPMGAGKWKPTYNEALRGRHVVILPDNDEPGQRHAEAVAGALRGVAASVCIVKLPGLPDKGDVTDWLGIAGNDVLKLLKIVEGAPREQKGKEAPKGKAKPVRTPAPYRPFPVDALPPAIREYVGQAALALGCDAAYIALPALAVAAGLIGYTRLLRLKRTWRVPCVLWTLVVADSGSLKTPAWQHAADYLFTLQNRLEAEFKRKLGEYAKAKEEWEAKVKAAKSGGVDPPGDEPEPPVQQTVFTSDATIEAIAELIGDNPRGIIVSCDELAGWLGSFTRYKGKAGGTDLPRWLSMHSAGGFAYHRKTGERRRIIVPHAAVSIAGGIQPGILARSLAGEFIEAGLASRLFMAMPPRPAKIWSELEIDPETEERYYRLLDALFALTFDNYGGEDRPHVLTLSPEAKAVWVRWYGDWGKHQAAVEGELAAAFSKLEEAPARLAILHHVASRLDRGECDLCPLQAESITAGITLACWFAYEAERVYAVLAEGDEQRDGRRLVEFIRGRGGKITARELQRSNGRKYPDAAAAEAALDALAETGLGQWIDPPEGKRARIMELCPTPDTSDIDAGDGSIDAQPVADNPSDNAGEPIDFPGKNGELSDMSDSRTETPSTPDDSGHGTDSNGQGPKLSDDAGYFGPYREGY